MFDEKLAITIAEQVREEGRRPSVRTVRQVLAATGNSGSLRRVAEVLRTWRKDRGLSEFEADTGVPPELQVRIDAVTAALWEAAKGRAEAALRAERERSSALATRLTEVQELNRSLTALNERLGAQVTDLERKQDRRAREFWDRVVIGVGDMLKGMGPSSTAEIFERLPSEVRREWLYHAEPLTAPTLRKKLKERSGRDRYVERVGDKWRCRAPEQGDDPSAPETSDVAKPSREAAV